MKNLQKKLKTLHLDDEPDYLELFKARFSRHLDITGASTREELLRLLGEDTWDVVILDYELPGCNGNELLLELKNAYPGLPVFLLTGQGNEEVARQSFLNGASDYFTKKMAAVGARERILNSIRSHVEKETVHRRLRNSRKLYQRVFESSGDAIFLFDHGKFVDCNGAATELFQCNKEDIIGRSFIDFSPATQPDGADSQALAREKIDNAIKVSPQCFQWTYKKLNGEDFKAEITLSRLKLEGRTLLLVLSRDLTARERVSRPLQLSGEYFWTLLENAPESLIWTDVYGKILFCNRAAEKMFERTRDDLVGSSVTTLHPFTPDQFNEEMYHRIIESGEVYENQVPIISASGKIRQVMIKASRVNVDGKDLVQGVFQDVTKELFVCKEIKHQLDFEELILRFTARFINLPYDEIDRGIEEALGEIARFTGSSRGVLLRLLGDPPVLKQTHLWRADPSSKGLSDFNGHSPGDFPFFWDSLRNKGLLMLSLPEDVPQDKLAEKEWFKNQGFRPSLAVSLSREGKPFGVLGFGGEIDQVREWDQSDIRLLRLAGEIIVSVISRKESEDARKSGEKEKMDILDSISEVVIYFPKGSLKASWVNRASVEHTGLAVEVFRQKNCYEIWHGRDVPCDGCPVMLAFETGKTEEGEVETPDGKTWLIRAYPVFREEGELKGVLQIGLDMTRVKKAERELALKQKQYRILAENATDVITLHDLDSTYTFVSPSIEECLGYKPEDFKGKRSIDYIHPQDLDKTIKTMKVLKSKGETINVTYRFRRKNGEYIWMESRGDLVLDEVTGQPSGFMMISRDVTPARKILKALEEQEEKFRKVFVLIQDGLFIVDAEHEIVEANPAGCKNHIYEKDEICGMKVDELIHSDDREYFNLMTGEVSQGRGFGGQVRCLRKDGSVFDSEVYGTPYQLNGQLHFLTCIRDVTRRNRLESELIARNRELADFTYRVTHDIKNPLNIIKGFIASINGNPVLLEKYQNRIMNQADLLIAFVDKLLKLSRSGMTIDAKEPVNVSRLVRSAFVINQGETPARLDIESELPQVMGDRQGLQQVFTNLVENALKFRDPEKQTLLITLTGRSDDKGMTFVLSDNGVGIPGELLEKIFSPGFTLFRDKGTGFGLIIARKIINAHQGSIRAESEGPGKGTSFIINFPSHLIVNEPELEGS